MNNDNEFPFVALGIKNDEFICNYKIDNVNLNDLSVLLSLVKSFEFKLVNLIDSLLEQENNICKFPNYKYNPKDFSDDENSGVFQ